MYKSWTGHTIYLDLDHDMFSSLKAFVCGNWSYEIIDIFGFDKMTPGLFIDPSYVWEFVVGISCDGFYIY